MADGLNAAALDIAGEALAAAIQYVSLHTGDPGVDGTNNVITGDRIPVDVISTNGSLSLSAPADGTGLTPGAEVAKLGMWTAATAGTYLGSANRSGGDGTVNASGDYTVESLSIPASSS